MKLKIFLVIHKIFYSEPNMKNHGPRTRIQVIQSGMFCHADYMNIYTHKEIHR